MNANDQTLQAMVDFHAENGYWPTVRELGERLNMTHKAAHKRLTKLLDVGAIIKFAPRAYKLPADCQARL